MECATGWLGCKKENAECYSTITTVNATTAISTEESGTIISCLQKLSGVISLKRSGNSGAGYENEAL
jgi:hypothetical protein